MLTETFSEAGWNVAEERAGAIGDRPGVNVIARHQSVDTTPAAIVIGAHYDTWWGTPGADDNASGVAGLLELAHVLGDQPVATRLELVAFDLEETEGDPAGSVAYVASRRGMIDTLQVALILEMIGYRCASQGCQKPVPAIPGCLEVEVPDVDVGTYVAAVGNPAARRWVRALSRVDRHLFESGDFFVNAIAVADDGRCFPDSRRSDNPAFWDAGLPAIMVVDTANFRNPHYHGSDDRPETLDYEFMANVVRAVAVAVSSASE